MNEMAAIRALNRERFHEIWKIAKDGRLDSLSGDELGFARIMLEHEEYHNQFEIADLLGDHEFDPGSEVNPFIHVVFHQIVENQLEAKDPIEALQFYNALRQKKFSRHETIHCITNVLAVYLNHAFRTQAEISNDRYVSLLKKFKGKTPVKVMAALEREFA